MTELDDVQPFLDARAAVRCPVALDLTIAGAERDGASDVVVKWRDAATSHRSAVLARLGAIDGAVVIDLERPGRRVATAAALAARAPVVCAPVLADDPVEWRRGRCDALLVDGNGYVPILVKRHRVADQSANGRAWSSSLDRPLRSDAVLVHGRRLAKAARDDAIELAHLWRLLEANGVAGPAFGGLVDAAGDLWWVDLAAPRGSGAASYLDRYDAEFALRRAVARRATERLENPDLDSLVVPLHKAECARCPYEAHCATAMEEADSVSLVPGMQWRHALAHRAAGRPTVAALATLDPRTAAVAHGIRLDADRSSLLELIELAAASEPSTPAAYLVGERMGLRRALRRAGVGTAADLAALDRTTASYAALDAGDLATAIDRARARVGAAAYLRRGLVERGVRRAGVEVDLDMERGDDGVYLWGLVIHLREPVVGLESWHGRYEAICSFDGLDEATEADLLRSLASTLAALERGAEEAGTDLGVYFYSHAEIDEIRRIATRSGDADLRRFATAFASSSNSVDLRVVAEDHLVLGHGFSLKLLAPYAGFAWRDEEPSGSASMTWYDRAVDDEDPEVRQRNVERILAYNEDDCRATYALRSWLEHGEIPRIESWVAPKPHGAPGQA